VAVVGTGNVGATFAYAACIQGLCREMVLINRTPEKAEGEAMDLHHSLPFLQPEVPQPKLSDQEGRDLARSARVLKESLAQAGYGDKEAA
jgi:malate/lactate dehydrogenase